MFTKSRAFALATVLAVTPLAGAWAQASGGGGGDSPGLTAPRPQGSATPRPATQGTNMSTTNRYDSAATANESNRAAMQSNSTPGQIMHGTGDGTGSVAGAAGSGGGPGK